MIKLHPSTKIEFKPITLQDKALYESYLFREQDRGCEFSFANLFSWGYQNMALLHDHILLFSRFDQRMGYPFPLGQGDKKPVLDAVLDDARARGITCRITGISEANKELLEGLYPERFLYQYDEGSFDYVYSIDDLADLKGKKYHGKRNHLNRFKEAYPDSKVEPLNESNLPRVRGMLDTWYRDRMEAGDYHFERSALEKAIFHHEALEMESLVLLQGEDVLAVTLGSRLSVDTFDVQFEKARADVNGAYTAINCEFARLIRSKYASIRFLNREEDMGLEGLRKAKKSYHPHHRVTKYRAVLREDRHDH